MQKPMTQIDISENQYQLMVNSIHGFSMLMLDTNGHILSWNPGAERMFGYISDKITGKPFSCLYTEAGNEQMQSQACLRYALEAGRYEEEVELLRQDGEPLWTNLMVTPLFENDVLLGYSLVIRDFSRRRESEENLRQTLKELKEIKYALDESAIVVITDKQGVITYVNDTFCKISKYSREELLGNTHRMINSGYHSKSFFKEMWETIGSGHVWHGEIRNKAKDGSYYWVDTTIVPYLDNEGKPYQYIAIRHDISLRKRVEGEIRQLNEEMEQRIHERTIQLSEANTRLSEMLTQLQESEKLRTTFIAALTHDLRTPLVAQERAIELFLNNRESLPPKLGLLAERLFKSNHSLLDMVNMLLETYQYEAGKIKINWDTVDLNALIENCFMDVMELAASKQITLNNQIPADFPHIPGDTHQLKRVFMNLIGNALENIPQGSEIKIMSKTSDDDITLTVQDNGPGISPEILPNLFERYYIGDQTRRKIGTGLGLYICRMIMQHHHGSIQVESNLGQGTSFYLTLLKQPLENTL